MCYCAFFLKSHVSYSQCVTMILTEITFCFCMAFFVVFWLPNNYLVQLVELHNFSFGFEHISCFCFYLKIT